MIEAPEILKAIIELFKSDSITSKWMAKSRNYYLTFAVASEHANEILPLIIVAENKFKEQFEKNLMNCSPLFNTLDRVNKYSLTNQVTKLITENWN